MILQSFRIVAMLVAAEKKFEQAFYRLCGQEYDTQLANRSKCKIYSSSKYTSAFI